MKESFLINTHKHTHTPLKQKDEINPIIVHPDIVAPNL